MVSVHASRSEIPQLTGGEGLEKFSRNVMVEVCSATAVIFSYYAARMGRGVVDWTLSKSFMQEQIRLEQRKSNRKASFCMRAA